MDFDGLLQMYEDKKRQYGNNAYLHLSEIFEEAREKYKHEYISTTRALKKISEGKVPDAEQSWKVFKGRNFEKLVWYMLEDQLKSLGLLCIPGKKLERKEIDDELNEVYRQLLVRYGKWAILPDTDLLYTTQKLLR